MRSQSRMTMRNCPLSWDGRSGTSRQLLYSSTPLSFLRRVRPEMLWRIFLSRSVLCEGVTARRGCQRLHCHRAPSQTTTTFDPRSQCVRACSKLRRPLSCLSKMKSRVTGDGMALRYHSLAAVRFPSFIISPSIAISPSTRSLC